MSVSISHLNLFTYNKRRGKSFKQTLLLSKCKLYICNYTYSGFLKKIAWISFWKLVWFLLSLEGTDALKLILKAIFDKSQLDFQHVFWKKWVLKNFAKNHKKTHVSESLFLTLLKKELWYRCFLMNLAKFLRTTFLKSISAGCFRKNIWSKNIFYQLIFETT